MPCPLVDPHDPARLGSAHTLRHKIKILLAFRHQLLASLRRPVPADLEHCNP